MYPPPQDDVSLIQSPQVQEYGVRFGFGPHIIHDTYQPPFSYEYILEEGKMPVLAEFHPVHKKNSGVERSKSHHSSSRKRPDHVVSIRRSASFQKQERQPLHFNMPVGTESTAEKLKRALSLSSGRISAQPSRNPSSASRREPLAMSSSKPSRHVSTSSRRSAAPISPRPSVNSQAGPPSESRVPSLILPTPTPSPEPYNSASSSPQKPPQHYGFPTQASHHDDRFSWASDDEDDFDELELIQDSFTGRLNPIPRTLVNSRRNKAFELLGITDKGVGLPRTPAPSAATSYRPSNTSSEGDYYSRSNSRRPSKDHRNSMLGQWNSPNGQAVAHQRVVTPISARSLDEDVTPRPIRQQTLQVSPSTSKPPAFQKLGPPKPEPIIVPDFPCPPVLEIRSAPSTAIPKPDSPVHAPQAKSLVLAEPRPLPPLVGKTSRFIEHLDANAKRLSLPLRRSPQLPHVTFAESRSMSDPDMIAPAPRRATSPLPPPMRSLPSPRSPTSPTSNDAQAKLSLNTEMAIPRDLESAGVRRSVSMRESATGPWGAVLCTAEARPIVATGHARMV